jgi:hypothetical protein
VPAACILNGSTKAEPASKAAMQTLSFSVVRLGLVKCFLQKWRLELAPAEASDGSVLTHLHYGVLQPRVIVERRS